MPLLQFGKTKGKNEIWEKLASINNWKMKEGDFKMEMIQTIWHHEGNFVSALEKNILMLETKDEGWEALLSSLEVEWQNIKCELSES